MLMKKIGRYTTILSFGLIVLGVGCSKKSGNSGGETPVPPSPPATTVKTDVSMWVTQADQAQLLKKQNTALNFSNGSNKNTTINVDTTYTYQTIDGFGFCLSGGSASLINSL